jgi:hypothetical protein
VTRRHCAYEQRSEGCRQGLSLPAGIPAASSWRQLLHSDKTRQVTHPRRHPQRSISSEALLLSPPQVKTAQFLGRLLAEHGHRAALLHGKRPQAEREVGDLLYFLTRKSVV